MMFLCIVTWDGSPVPEQERADYMTRMQRLGRGELTAVSEPGFYAIMAPEMVPLRPLSARRRGLLAVGNVRLDNREEVRTWSGTGGPSGDLELVLEAYLARGARCIPGMLGDFAFVLYDPRAHTLVAARDAFGVKTMFIGRRQRLFVLSSHLEPVHTRDDLDEEFVADFLLAGDPGPERSIWADSCAVPQGSVLSARDGKIHTQRFWRPHDFEPAEKADELEQAERMRVLFSEAVRTRLEPNSQTWAELSGGLDSSSVVSVAQNLLQQGTISEGIASTVTLVDELGSGDERRFSNAVLQRYPVRNEVIWNPSPWEDGGRQPRASDEPRAHYPFFLRDEMECDLIRRQGATVLLSGVGSDHYLYGNRLCFSDWAARGQPGRAIREIVRWSIAEKQSVWTGLWRHLVLPLAPAAIGRRFAPSYDRVPPWIDLQFGRRTGITDRLAASRTSSAQRGSRFATEVANELQELTRWLQRGPFEDRLEMRYPFLYRPLVELGLQLPIDLRARPLAPKWLLRQALRGILPEAVRVRSGKGAIDSRILWAMSKKRGRLGEILRVPYLGELGFILPDRLRAALAEAREGRAPNLVMLLAVVSLETWFFVRSGRWTVDEQSAA
jgi:asparagine synthase (glutamine-hydrolysing)